jgi:hypothetical protein
MIIMALVGAAFLTCSGRAEAELSGDYEFVFTNDGNGIEIVKYLGSGGDVSIPSSFNGRPVVAIGNSAFSNPGITSVVVPQGVTSIGDMAFAYCPLLVNVSLPASLTSLGNMSFMYCSSLLNFHIPVSVSYIGNYPFALCPSLVGITVDPGNVNFTSLDGILYDAAMSSLLACPGGETGAVSIPNNVTFIAEAAFAFSSISSIVIPANVAAIENHTFYACRSLVSVEMKGGVATIGLLAFAECSALTSVAFSNDTAVIEEMAFYNCSSLVSVDMPVSVHTIGHAAFQGCTALSTVIISPNVSVIPDDAFSGCSALTQAVIPEGVSAIGFQSFWNCRSLPSVVLPSSLTKIDWFAFSQCSSLITVTIPPNATVGLHAFYDCSALVAIEVDARNPYVTSLEGVLYSWDRIVIYQCPGGKTGSVTLPRELIVIGDMAFTDCTQLQAIYVDPANSNYASIDGVLYNKALTEFRQCPGGKTSVDSMPERVTIISNWAFSKCSRLTSVTIPNNVTQIGYMAFEGCTALAHISLPDRLITIADFAFKDCRSLASVTIPSNVSEIRTHAFAGCTSLISILFEGNAPNPSYDYDWIPEHNRSLVIYYRNGATGFTDPYKDAPAVEVPWVPSGPVITALYPGEGMIGIAWSAPSRDGGRPILRYQLFCSTNITPDVLYGVYDSSTRFVNVTGLVYGTYYHFGVRAMNEIGVSEMSSMRWARPWTIADPPTLVAVQAGHGQVTLSWIAPQNTGGAELLAYQVYCGQGSQPLSLVGQVSASADSYHLFGLDSGVSYRFALVVVNSAGDSNLSNQLEAVPYTIPGAPTGLVAVRNASGALLSWAAPLDNGSMPITGFSVYRCASSDGDYVFVASSSGTDFLDSGINASQPYWYMVRAVNIAGEGDHSSAIEVAPLSTVSTDIGLLLLLIGVIALVIIVVVVVAKRHR